MGITLRNLTAKQQVEDVAAMLRGAAEQVDALSVVFDAKPVAGAIIAPVPFGMFAERHDTGNAVTYSTWYHQWGGIKGAAHSVEAWGLDRSKWPKWTHGKKLILRPNGLDVAMFGCTMPARAPQALRHGDMVRLRGFIAGTKAHHETRNGTAYMARPEDLRDGDAPSWIIKMLAGEDAAHGGMSGGPVTVVQADGSEILVAELITQNGRADLDGDGKPDNSSDVVEDIDVWMAVTAEQNTAHT